MPDRVLDTPESPEAEEASGGSCENLTSAGHVHVCWTHLLTSDEAIH